MSYAICSLFEGHYHFGLAALINSAYRRGFRGSIYAGYKGTLPDWCNNSSNNSTINWEGSKMLQLREGLQVHFLPVDTNYHFSNYKPTFMLELFEGPAKDVDGLIYFDPDIVIKCNSKFFDEWLSYGVAVILDVSWNIMPPSHPVRKGWEKLITNSNREVTSVLHSYLNSGFCGVSKNNAGFLKVWAEFIELSFSDFGHRPHEFLGHPRTTSFYCADQDAFNIAAMCSGYPISEIGADGMDFIPGGWTLSHALGRPKPWNKKFIRSALAGRPPSQPDKLFWSNVFFPISPFGKKRKVIFEIYCLKIASFIGRFYRRY